MNHSKSRKGLFVGINDYHKYPLKACENDARAMKEMLEVNAKDDPNFSPMLELNPTTERLKERLEKLLADERGHALFYFSGHGYVDKTGGYLVGRDFTDEEMGVSMQWLVECINRSQIDEITVILDCCHAGGMANLFGDENREEIAQLRKNVTILAASMEEELATEVRGHGKFTQILLDGLQGGAADLAGNVTAAGLYNMADSMLSPWQQRPVYKSFVTQMSPLRYCEPKTSHHHVRQLATDTFFRNQKRVIQLSPHDISTDPKGQPNKVEFFSILLAFHQAGLIECDNGSLYAAALNEGTCWLTPYGEHLHDLITKNRF